jgi:hypothetical protein
MQTINWTTGDGRDIELTVTAEYGLNLRGVRKTSGRKEVEIIATVDGEEVYTHGGLIEINHPVAVAKIGDIGLSRENYDRVKAAITVVESEIAEHNAACDRHARSIDAIDDGRRSIERAMRCGE